MSKSPRLVAGGIFLHSNRPLPFAFWNIGYSLLMFAEAGLSRYPLPPRFLVIFEYGGLIP
jgi:hypothetical protein